ncbi:MAG: protein kinase family protein [Legionellales bacterium]|nr:protein kinase family protein [Legionellales bacterium]
MTQMVLVPHLSNEFVMKYRKNGKPGGNIKIFPLTSNPTSGTNGSYFPVNEVYLVEEKLLKKISDLNGLEDLAVKGLATKKTQTTAGHRYAVKVIRPLIEPDFLRMQNINWSAYSADLDDYEDLILNENELLRRFSGVGASWMVAKDQETDQYYIFLYQAPGEELFSMFFVTKTPFSPKQLLAISVEIAWELTGLHKHDIVHGDLKPQNMNCLIKNGEVSDLSFYDFGFGCHVKQATIHRTGTFGYIPFDIHNTLKPQPKYDAKRIDVFAVGTIILEILTGKHLIEYCKIKAAEIEEAFFQEGGLYKNSLDKVLLEDSKMIQNGAEIVESQKTIDDFRNTFKVILCHYIYPVYTGRISLDNLNTFNRKRYYLRLKESFNDTFMAVMTTEFFTSLTNKLCQHLSTAINFIGKTGKLEYQLSPFSQDLLKAFSAKQPAELGLSSQKQKEKLISSMISVQLSGQIDGEPVTAAQLTARLQDLYFSVNPNPKELSNEIAKTVEALPTLPNNDSLVKVGSLAASIGKFSNNSPEGKNELVPASNEEQCAPQLNT